MPGYLKRSKGDVGGESLVFINLLFSPFKAMQKAFLAFVLIAVLVFSVAILLPKQQVCHEEARIVDYRVFDRVSDPDLYYVSQALQKYVWNYTEIDRLSVDEGWFLISINPTSNDTLLWKLGIKLEKVKVCE